MWLSDVCVSERVSSDRGPSLQEEKLSTLLQAPQCGRIFLTCEQIARCQHSVTAATWAKVTVLLLAFLCSTDLDLLSIFFCMLCSSSCCLHCTNFTCLSKIVYVSKIFILPNKQRKKKHYSFMPQRKNQAYLFSHQWVGVFVGNCPSVDLLWTGVLSRVGLFPNPWPQKRWGKQKWVSNLPASQKSTSPQKWSHLVTPNPESWLF